MDRCDVRCFEICHFFFFPPSPLAPSGSILLSILEISAEREPNRFYKFYTDSVNLSSYTLKTGGTLDDSVPSIQWKLLHETVPGSIIWHERMVARDAREQRTT